MNELRDYLMEIEELSENDNELFLNLAMKMLNNLRKNSKKNIQLRNHIPALLKVIYCHRRNVSALAA